MNDLLKFISFCFIGITSNFLIDLGIFNLLMYLLSFNLVVYGVSTNFILSTIIAMSISLIYSFIMNRNITFSAERGSIKKHFLRYIVVYSLTILINFLVSFFVIRLLGESISNNNLARISGILIAIPVSFFGSLLWVFKKEI